MRTEIDNWKRAVVFVECACVNGSPRVVRGVANPIISRLSRFFTKLRLSVLTAKFVKDLVNQGREPFVGFSPVTFQSVVLFVVDGLLIELFVIIIIQVLIF